MVCECGRPAAKGRPKCWGCYSSKSRNGSTARKRPQNGVRHENPIEALQEAVIALGDAKAEVETIGQIERAQRDRLMARVRVSYARLRRWVSGGEHCQQENKDS